MPLSDGSGVDELVTRTVAKHVVLSILAALPDASVLAFDPELRFVFGAGAALGRHGFTPEDLTGRACQDVLGERWAIYENAYRAALAGHPSSIEVNAPDGDRRYLVEVSPARSDLGEVTGGVVIARDVTELRRLEREARTHEHLQQVGFDGSLTGAARTDLDGRFLEVNQAFVDLLGYSRQRLTGMTSREMTDPRDLPADLAAEAEMVRGARRTYRAEKRYLCADRRTVWALISVVLIPAGVRPAHLFTQAIDITDRKRAEAQRALQATITERMGDGVALVDARNRTIVYANNAFSSMLGYEPGELDGQALAVVSAPAEPTDHDVASEIVQAIARDEVWNGRIQNVRKDGSACWCWASVTELEHPDHGPLWVSVHNDISQVKRSEDALREAQERFEQAFEKAPIGMALVGLDGRFLRVNQALCRITGYDQDELTTMCFQDITHREDLDAGVEYAKRLMAGEIRDYQIEKRYLKADGSIVWINLSATLIRDTRDQPLHFIAQIQDVSDRQRLEARLRDLADHDSLTGLRNRRVFEEALLIQVGRCQRYAERAALLMIDMDDFKAINDTHGHKAGDRTLITVAAAIVRRIRVADIAARLGGDEFAVLLAHIGEAEATSIAQDVGAAIEASTVPHGNRTIHPRASIGVAFIDQHSVGDEAVLAIADRAMYAAKPQPMR